VWHLLGTTIIPILSHTELKHVGFFWNFSAQFLQVIFAPENFTCKFQICIFSLFRVRIFLFPLKKMQISFGFGEAKKSLMNCVGKSCGFKHPTNRIFADTKIKIDKWYAPEAFAQARKSRESSRGEKRMGLPHLGCETPLVRKRSRFGFTQRGNFSAHGSETRGFFVFFGEFGRGNPRRNPHTIGTCMETDDFFILKIPKVFQKKRLR